MKINTELERLLQTEQLRKQQSPTAGNSGTVGFENLLAKQLGQPEAGAAPEALQALADPTRLANIGVTTLAGLEGADNASEDDKIIEQLTGGIGQTLQNFDKLASSLQSGSSDSLKSAWAALQNMDGEIAGLRQDMGRLSKPDAGLESMINELEVLAATEKFKFNRGDYL